MVQCTIALDIHGAAQYFSAVDHPKTRPFLLEEAMLESIQKTTEDFQKAGKANYETVLSSYGELSKGFQAIGNEVTDYSKRAFEDATRTFQQLVGAKSLEQAFEIQSDYAKKAYDNWMAETSRIGEMYAAAARDAYKPVEKAMTRPTA
jgi:hypothetical protein